MLLLCSSSPLLSNPVKPHRAASLVTESVNLQAHKPKSIPTTIPTRQSWVSFCSPTYLGKGLVFPPHPTPELGLLSLWFVLSLVTPISKNAYLSLLYHLIDWLFKHTHSGLCCSFLLGCYFHPNYERRCPLLSSNPHRFRRIYKYTCMRVWCVVWYPSGF